MTSQYARPWLQPNQYARNGKYPDALFQSELAGLANHVLMFRTKEVASFGMSTAVIAAGGASARPRWRCRYVPSPGARGVVARGWLAESDLEDPSAAPYALVEIVEATAATESGVAELYFGAASADNANPDHTSVLWTLLRDGSDATQVFAPVDGHEYEVTISDVQSRIIAITIYEVWLDGSATPLRDSYATTGPILDTDRGEILTAARAMWKRGAASLLQWSVDDQASPRTTTSATAKNLVDNSSTSVSAATPGYTLDLRNRARLSATTVPCVLAVYGSSTDEGEVQVKDSAGAIVGACPISGSAAWSVAEIAFPATRATYDLHFVSSVGETTSIHAVHLYQWQDGD